MTNNPPATINLAKGKNKNLLDRFLKWALTIGRLIVILTEIVALSTFLYRFSLDRQLIDLHDKISAKQAIIKLLKDNEDKYRNLQGRLAMASTLSNEGLKTTQLLNDLLGFTSNDFIFTTLTLSKDSVGIEAKAQSAKALSNFIKALKAYPKISSVSLDSIENKTSSAIIFANITAVLKK